MFPLQLLLLWLEMILLGVGMMCLQLLGLGIILGMPLSFVEIFWGVLDYEKEG